MAYCEPGQADNGSMELKEMNTVSYKMLFRSASILQSCIVKKSSAINYFLAWVELSRICEKAQLFI